jgi:hypothetical protein
MTRSEKLSVFNAALTGLLANNFLAIGNEDEDGIDNVVDKALRIMDGSLCFDGYVDHQEACPIL